MLSFLPLHSSPFRPSGVVFLFFLNKHRFCYRSGAGVRQRNRMSARAGCDVSDCRAQASKYRKPARLLATQTLSFLCVPLFSSLLLCRFLVLLRPHPLYARCFSPPHVIRYFEIRYGLHAIRECNFVVTINRRN